MAGTLVDTNVLLDIVQQDDDWFDWSTSMLELAAHDGHLWINPIIYAEVAAFYTHIEDLDDARTYVGSTTVRQPAGQQPDRIVPHLPRRGWSTGGARTHPLFVGRTDPLVGSSGRRLSRAQPQTRGPRLLDDGW